MSQPVYLPKLETTVDGYVDSNAAVTKQITARRNAFGGMVFEHTILPNNSGGSVGLSQGTGSSSIKTYNTNDAVLPNMALVYNSFGGIVTTTYTDAILSPTNQTNFIGVAKTATKTNVHNWIQLPFASNQPGARMYHAMVYIPSAQVHLLHGGLGTNSNLIYSDTLLWDGHSWASYLGSNPTNGRYGHAVTVDTTHTSGSTNQNMVLIFGGANGVTGLLDETWRYDGLTWFQLTPGTSPSARVHAAMAFHAANGLTILYGGYVGGEGSPISSQTWTLDVTGPNWTQQTPTTSPGPRTHHCMCYDPVRQRTVLFGGTDGTNQFNDTWEWDGTNWQLIQLTNSPSARIDAAMTYDPINKVIVLFGGYQDPFLNANGSFNIYSDVWYYDGTTWAQQQFFGPVARAGAAISFDKFQNYMLMFGGANGGTTRDLVFNNSETATYQDSWELLTLTNQVDVQTTGDTYVYWDATDLLSIAPGGFVRGNDNLTVTVTSKLPHGFSVGNQFFIKLPGDTNFASGSYTVTAVADDNHFSYSNSGTATSSVVALMIESLGPSITHLGSEVPTVNRYLSAGGIPGTVTPNGFGSSNDGYSPIFGIVSEAPVVDTDGSVLQTLIGNDRVGLVKMKMGAFYGFIAGLVPQIRYLTPVSGPTGTNFRVVGDGLNTTTQVLFGNDAYGNVSAEYHVVSANQINVTVPPGAQTYGGVGVVTSTGSIVKSFTVTPQILSITAAAHSIGTVITLNGTTFAPAAGIGVTFPAAGTAPSTLSFTGPSGPITTSFIVIDDQTIQVTIPSNAITGPITLTTPDGSTSFNFDVLLPPTITLIAPLSGPTGAEIAVTGTGFLTPGGAGDGYGTLQFKNGGQLLPIGSAIKTVYNDTTMTVTVPTMPSGQGSTAFNLQLSNNAGTVISSQQFTTVAAPQFLTGPASPSTLNGGIDNVVASITVVDASIYPTSGKFFIGSEQISYSGKSSNTFTGCVRGINGTTAASHLTGASVIVKTFAAPDDGYSGIAGTLVRIFGDFGFTGVSSVSFGAYEAATISFINDGYITATVPNVISSSDVIAPITVISTGGIANTSTSHIYNNFTIEQAPTITAIFNPSVIVTATAPSGKTGDTVYLTGTNFLGVTDVRFAGMISTATFSVVNPTTISVVVPSNDGHIVVAPSSGAITIKKSTFFTVTSSQLFTYYPPPTSLTIASPAQDSGGGGGDTFHANGGYGTSVTLSGFDLDQGGNPYVSFSFGGITTFPSSHSPTSPTVIVPTGANNGLTLTTAGGTIGPITFNVLKPVHITSISTPKFYLGQWYATPYYPDSIDVFGANFRDSDHMSIVVQDGTATATIGSFTFHDSGHVTFSVASLGAFSGGDLCNIILTTFYPGGSYTYTLNNAFICYFPIF